MNLATNLERLVARKPENPIPKRYVNDLEKVLQGASVQQAQMETPYYTQSYLVKPKEVNENKKTFTDMDKAYAKAAEAATDIIYAWQSPDTGAPLTQAKLAIRIAEDLKPKEVLSSGASNERFKHWRKQQKAFMEQNKEALTKQEIKVTRAYFEGDKLSICLATLRDDKGKNKKTDVTTILGQIVELYEDIQPLRFQTMIYFKANQGTNETFEDIWTQRTIMKENYKLQDGLTSKVLKVLELLRRGHTDELLKELLKVKNPKKNKLLQVLRGWVHGLEMDRNFKNATSA